MNSLFNIINSYLLGKVDSLTDSRTPKGNVTGGLMAIVFGAVFAGIGLLFTISSGELGGNIPAVIALFLGAMCIAGGALNVMSGFIKNWFYRELALKKPWAISANRTYEKIAGVIGIIGSIFLIKYWINEGKIEYVIASIGLLLVCIYAVFKKKAEYSNFSGKDSLPQTYSNSTLFKNASQNAKIGIFIIILILIILIYKDDIIKIIELTLERFRAALVFIKK